MEVVNDFKKQIKEKWENSNNGDEIIALKLLYNMSRNAAIEEKKKELFNFFQIALNNFKSTSIGAKYAREGWLESNLIKDGLHNIILNSSTCKRVDQLFGDYTLDYIVFFSECCDDFSSPMYSAITAYKYLCQIEEKEKKKIDNDVIILEDILGPYISSQTQAFYTPNEAYIYDNKKAEAYEKLWYIARSNAIKFYKDKCSIGRRGYKNIRIILDTIDEIFTYYINGPKSISIKEKQEAKTLQKKSS